MFLIILVTKYDIAYMMLIDSSYERNGDIDPENILRLIDISEDVKDKQDKVNKIQINYVIH